MTEHYLPLPEGVLLDGCWLMHDGYVNINDLVSGKPGRVIRMRHMDALRYIPAPMDNYDRIAGLISDAA
jgi:hypothetical protein